MWILLLGLTSGLLASSWASSVQEVKARSCSFAGVFHIQGNQRYSLDFDGAQKLCEALGTTLATNDQVTAAHDLGMESCRYGWISSGNITIPRHVSNPLCARNMTGVITLAPSESLYDAYCYNQTDQTEKNCNFEIKYVESDHTFETSDNIDNQNWNQTEIPTGVFIDITVTDVTDLSDATEKVNPTPTSTHDEHDILEKVLDQNTQPPTTNATPAGEGEALTTESTEHHSGESGEGGEEHTTMGFNQDITGSGMGETSQTTISELTNEDSKDTREDHDFPNKPTTANEHVSRGERMEPGMALPPKDKANSSNSKDWLVILIVVVAIVAIILVCALVVTRNRWCGKSQTLMITSKSSSEGNGTAASAASPQAQEREQEMVTLMNKEKIQENGNTEEFTVITLEESPDKNQEA